MLRFKAVFLLAIICLLTISYVQAANLSSFFDNMGSVEKIFPEKYDEVLSRLYRSEDRIVFIFREMTMAQLNQSLKKEEVLNKFLKKALNRYWLLESNEFKKIFLSDSKYYTFRMKKYLAKLPCTYDQAAFSFLFENIYKDVSAIKPFAKSSAKALQCLKTIEHQRGYAAEISKSKSFYRKIPHVFKVVTKVNDKIDRLIEKFQQKFLLEKMVLACDKIIPQKDGQIRSALSKLKNKLIDRLVKKIYTNLEAQFETGIGKDAVTGISKSSQGVMIRQTLYQGRIRVFVKQMQKSENIRQFNCYLPIMRQIENCFAKLKRTISDASSKATLDKMRKNFDEMKLVIKLKLRGKNEDSQEFRTLTKQFEQSINSKEVVGILKEL